MLRHGVEAADYSAEQDEAIEAHIRTGRPLATQPLSRGWKGKPSEVWRARSPGRGRNKKV